MNVRSKFKVGMVLVIVLLNLLGSANAGSAGNFGSKVPPVTTQTSAGNFGS